jgi:phosphatidate cytidylyltransferase
MKIQSNFVLRTITGTVFVAAILASMLSFWSFWGLMSLVLILTLYEYRKLLQQKEVFVSGVVFTIVVFSIIYIYEFCYGASVRTIWTFSLMIIFLLFGMFVEQLYSKKGNPIQNIVFSVFPLFYIIVPFACLIYLHSINPLYALALFSFVWVNDPFAYLTGITIGKHRLFERISPKKSWEGFFGGLVFAVLAGVAFNHFTTEIFGAYSLIKWIVFAVIVVIAGTFGDLFESLFKRSLEVKDSGTILPGHGGLLDRFDSILFAAPAAMIYLIIVASA